MKAKPLTPAQMEVLEFERTPWKYQGAKDDMIRTRFGLTAVAYAQRLHKILDLPAAEVYDPELVRRLRRLRDDRQRLRGSRTTGYDLDQAAGS